MRRPPAAKKHTLFGELGAHRGLEDEESADEVGETLGSAAFEREFKALRDEGVLMPEEFKKRELKRFEFGGSLFKR